MPFSNDPFVPVQSAVKFVACFSTDENGFRNIYS